MKLHPGSRNVIPGEVAMSIDLRHLEPEVLDEMAAELESAIEEISTRHGLVAELTPTADFAPESFDRDCVGAVRNAARQLHCSYMDIVSGAGHDAIFVGRVAPAAMIFVPCENGISHNEIENATPEDLHSGCNVLLHAMLEFAQVIDADQE